MSLLAVLAERSISYEISLDQVREINNYVGDMDLFLLDFILKGKIPLNAKVLDAGCGEGRNAIYFIRNGNDFLGVDSDESKVRLAQYMGNNISTSKAKFEVGDIRQTNFGIGFDLVICSRVLHFSKDVDDFLLGWEKLVKPLKSGGLIYVSMDSVIENTLGKQEGDGHFEFPDGQVRFSLTEELYEKIKKGFDEIEPLKTLIQNKVRAQSFMLLRKH